MKRREQEYLETLCHSLAKAIGAAVRLFTGRECVYYYSVYHLHPDPAQPFLDQLLQPEYGTGVITTPLYQFYGYLTLPGGWRIVVGPSRPENDSPRLLDEQMFLLGVPAECRDEYIHILRCFPMITAGRMGWLVAFLAEALLKKPFDFEKMFMNIRPEEHRDEIEKDRLRYREEAVAEENTQALLDNGYRFEKLILSYIEHGEPGKLKELLSAPPAFLAGQMSRDTLHQVKAAGICGAAIASRAAIAGGLDSRVAFRMSDLYIQKIDLLGDSASLHRLRNDMFIDFAEEVEKVRYHTLSSPKAGSLFRECADYISQNIYSPIRAEEVADAVGYTRSYLSNCFKKQAGMTLTQYILQEKIVESRRMLQFTDKSLSEIAALFGFSSQSHFQNVYKRITGETPLAYRKRVR